ncbi:hypothetical protein GEMRC1_001541 [Eukaryota sp. GEM-RC1]
MSSFIEYAAQNRADVMSHFDSGVLLLAGGKAKARHDTDRDEPHRSESNFFYVTGINEPDCTALIDVTHNKYIIFTPELPKSLEMWMGKIPSFDELKERYQADEVLDEKDLPLCSSFPLSREDVRIPPTLPNEPSR